MRSRPAPVSTEGFGRGLRLAAGVAIELHEDQIPDFDVAAAIAGELAIGVALIGGGRAHVVVRFRCTGRTGQCRPWPRNFLSGRELR